MDWKDYEKEIEFYFKEQYPSAEITHNKKVKGRYSGVDRQIDILIEDYIAGNRLRIIIDGKFFSEKIDVKDVEMFIGMLDDCEAHKGLLITSEGFTQAAINRAFNSPTTEVELDILNFKELHDFQGMEAVPFHGKHGVLIQAPFGWVIDATRRKDMLATLYQRGLTLSDAGEQKEWMYINIKSKDDECKILDDFLEQQRYNINNHYQETKITYIPTIKRDNTTIKLRVLESSQIPTKEYTGFVEFDDFIFFCVLFTPDELSKKNIRKMENLMMTAIPISVISDV